VAWLRMSDRAAEGAMESFEHVFLRRTPFETRHDAYLSVPFFEPLAALAEARRGGGGGGGGGKGKKKEAKGQGEAKASSPIVVSPEVRTYTHTHTRAHV
jgi:hypothetical protein